jgi:hypothetical protein
VTRKEADKILHWLQWFLSDKGHMVDAGMVEDSRFVVNRAPIENIRAFAKYVLPPGKRGRIRLCMTSPFLARVRAMHFGILTSIES